MTALAPSAPRLRDPSGAVVHAPATRWFGSASPAEHRALADVAGPVLDIGCGPGRHVLALAERGVPSLGIDITAPALRHARAKGVAVLERCVFDRVPAAGRWRSALLLDGNLCIGGDPMQLLRRVRELLAPAGGVLVETEPAATRAPDRIRFEVDAFAGPWFAWTAVAAADLGGIATAAGFHVARTWTDDGRCFGWLRS